MLFLKKSKVIFAYKIICALFVMTMLFMFIRMTIIYEKEIDQEKLIENNWNDENILHKEKYANDVNIRIPVFSENYTDNCKTNYLLYYAGALILGAYVNFKKLYKMGPI